jgi:hypothetical protein
LVDGRLSGFFIIVGGIVGIYIVGNYIVRPVGKGFGMIVNRGSLDG